MCLTPQIQSSTYLENLWSETNTTSTEFFTKYLIVSSCISIHFQPATISQTSKTLHKYKGLRVRQVKTQLFNILKAAFKPFLHRICDLVFKITQAACSRLFSAKALRLCLLWSCSRAHVHGGAGRRSGRHPAAAHLPGDALQVLQDRAHALLQEPLRQRRRGRRWVLWRGEFLCCWTNSRLWGSFPEAGSLFYANFHVFCWLRLGNCVQV